MLDMGLVKGYKLDVLYLYLIANYFGVEIFYTQEWAVIKVYMHVESMISEGLSWTCSHISMPMFLVPRLRLATLCHVA